MRRLIAISLLLPGTLAVLSAASVGSGSTTAAIQASFINAYNRGLFSLFVNTPTTDVRALGSPGLIQEFPSKTSASIKFALIKPDPNAPLAQFDTLQVYSDIYSQYTAIGVTVAGYPANDTTACPTNTFGVCNYQFFSKNYAIMVYSSPLTASFSVRDPFYTLWAQAGGLSGVYGVVTATEVSVTSGSKVVGTQQAFLGGSVYSYPAGSATPVTFGVSGDFFKAWSQNGGLAVLGFPASPAVQAVAGGPIRQSFESGRIEQIPGSDPVVLFPVSLVDITFAAQGLSLVPGATATISASTLDTRGSTVTGRTFTWSSTNGAVARVTGNGNAATVQAISAGTANIFVTVEGKTSGALTVRVGGACCLVGEGAPSVISSQAFQSALDRNQLVAVLPVPAPAARAGAGYIQAVTANGIFCVISQADGAPSAFINTGAIYAAYVTTGSFSGALGFPVSDPIPGGAQRYASGVALGGNPVRLVLATTALRWFGNGGPTGALGSPVTESVPFQSVLGTNGTTQTFSSGAVFAFASGQTRVSSGLVLAKYSALAGPGGALGAPISELTTTNGVLRQEFETGFIDLQPGATAAVEHFNLRIPALSVSPATVVPGGRVRIRATGFAPGSSVNFTVTGQPNFSVRVATGAFDWEIFVPLSARAGSITVQATAPAGDAASGTYTITPAAALLPKLSILSGDQQTGVSGSTLAAPVTAFLSDSSGAPLAGVAVGWSLSPGASVTAPATTDANGRIAGIVRLPAASGVAVGAISAAGQVVSFSALATAKIISGFPAYPQASANGAFAATLASLLRFHQNQGTLGTPSGLATVSALDQYLTANNGGSTSDSGNSVPNPWVAARFADARLIIESASLNRVRDLVATGIPVAVVLRLSIDGRETGGTTVAAVGVNADGSIAIHDPDPSLGRNTLADYLAGFTAQGRSIRGVISAVIRFVSGSVPVSAFSIASPLGAGSSAGTVFGPCPSLDIGDQGNASGVRIHFCDGIRSSYELDLNAEQGATVLDLTSVVPTVVPANGTVSWSVTRVGGTIAVAPQLLSVTSVHDAAAFGPALAPGSIITIFGTGLTGGGRAPAVTLGSRTLQLLLATPFQINAVIPADAPPGNATLQVTGTLGTSSAPVTLLATSPAIFGIGTRLDGLTQGAIVNQDGTVNGPDSPAQRGQFISIYATGLGATQLRNGLQTTVIPVTVTLHGGTPLASSFAGLVPGYAGLYQVNVQVPATTPPGSAVAVALTQAGKTSNLVVLGLQ